MTGESKQEKYNVTFELTMPGQTRATQYVIPVDAGSRAEALVKAEGEWAQITGSYDVRVKTFVPKEG